MSTAKQPLRQRKQVEFFAPGPKPQTEKLVIKQGKGVKLADIPNVAYKLSKVTGRDELLEDFHFLLFRRKGKLATRKRDLQAFSGYDWTEEVRGKELESLQERLGRWKVEHLNRLMDLLDLPRGSGEEAAKEKKLARLVGFLEAPHIMSSVDLAAKDAKRKLASHTKRKRVSKQGPRDEHSKKRRQSGSAEAAAEDGEAAKDTDDVSDQEDDDLPLASVGKLPSNKALRAEVLSILRGVNVQEFNLSMLMEHLFEKFKVDLKPKKPFIKNIAIEYCASSASADDGDNSEGGQQSDGGEDPGAGQETAGRTQEAVPAEDATQHGDAEEEVPPPVANTDAT